MDEGKNMVDLRLGRIVFRENSERQYIYMTERGGHRGFTIVIGSNEATEIHRVVMGFEVPRPLTHQLTASIVDALGARIKRCDIVDMRDNTYFAQLVIQTEEGDTTAVIDARPSDAIALALRSGSPIRVAESVLESVRQDNEGSDPLPPEEEGENEE